MAKSLKLLIDSLSLLQADASMAAPLIYKMLEISAKPSNIQSLPTDREKVVWQFSNYNFYGSLHNGIAQLLVDYTQLLIFISMLTLGLSVLRS